MAQGCQANAGDLTVFSCQRKSTFDLASLVLQSDFDSLQLAQED